MTDPSRRPPEPPEDRGDLRLICDMVREGAKVLDVGCGDGALLKMLSDRKNIAARGVELNQADVNECVARGLSVVQGDADADLETYPDRSFDYVIMSHTIQATNRPKTVLQEMLRIGRRGIVSFPNFAHWPMRFQIAVKGHMPMTDNLSVPWYETPNVHFCSIRDFRELTEEIGATVEREIAFDGKGRRFDGLRGRLLANLMAERAVFLLSKRMP